MEPAALIEVHEVDKRFGRVEVLRHASMAARRGEVVGVAGENGSGKSTLLRIVAGTLRPDSGVVHRSGTIGYCPQEPVVFGSLTIEQNLTYFGAAYGLAAPETDRRGGALMDRLRCGWFRGRPVRELSGGTIQKLNLIVALLHEPDLLLLDEPYQGLDYEAYLAFWEIAAERARSSRSVIVVSHLVHDRYRLSRLYRLADGRTVDG